MWLLDHKTKKVIINYNSQEIPVPHMLKITLGGVGEGGASKCTGPSSFTWALEALGNCSHGTPVAGSLACNWCVAPAIQVLVLGDKSCCHMHHSTFFCMIFLSLGSLGITPHSQCCKVPMWGTPACPVCDAADRSAMLHTACLCLSGCDYTLCLEA